MTTQKDNLPLEEQKCEACEGKTKGLDPSQIKSLESELDDDWHVVDQHHLSRSFDFPDFRQALAFTNKVGDLAEEEGHHPDLSLSWGKVGVSLRTHSVDALTKNDFILASKISELPREA